jgi:transcriptional regulator GlxA family with amidase domain
MKHVSILVPEMSVLASIEDPRYMFTAGNDFLATVGKPPLFNVQLVGANRIVSLHDGIYHVNVDAVYREVEQTNLIFIPAITGDIKSALEVNRDLVPWIVNQYKKGAEIASLCMGAFLLASTGLLNGKHCSTHWLHANTFRNMFPEVTLMDDKIITEERGIYTSGGANSYWNLLLYLIEKHTSREIAILASKFFAIEIDRNSQSPFMMFRGQRDHEDEAIRKAQEFIEHHFHNKITVDQLSDMFSIGRRSLERRFKKATHNTVTEYIQRVKVEAAKKSFETSRKNVSEVMYDVGYADTKAFRTIFKKIAGLSPLEYRNKYNREVMAA